MTIWDVLKGIEWMGPTHVGTPTCPACTAYKPHGHLLGCMLKALMARQAEIESALHELGPFQWAMDKPARDHYRQAVVALKELLQ